MKKDPTEFRKRFAAWKDGKDPYRYLYDDQTGKWNRITNDDVADVFADFVATPQGNRNSFSMYENIINPVVPISKNTTVVPDNTLWTRQQVEKTNDTRSWRSDAADIMHSIGEGALLTSDFIPFGNQITKSIKTLSKPVSSKINTLKNNIGDVFQAFKNNYNIQKNIQDGVYYHGSPYKNLTTLNTGRAGGIFFTNDNLAARGYTGAFGTGRVYSANLDLGINPITINAEGYNIAAIPDKVVSDGFKIPIQEIQNYIKPHHTFKAAFGRPEMSFYDGDRVFELGKKLGHSSVTLKGSLDSGKGIFGKFREIPYDQTVVYSPNQVKLLNDITK